MKVVCLTNEIVGHCPDGPQSMLALSRPARLLCQTSTVRRLHQLVSPVTSKLIMHLIGTSLQAISGELPGTISTMQGAHSACALWSSSRKGRCSPVKGRLHV